MFNSGVALRKFEHQAVGRLCAVARSGPAIAATRAAVLQRTDRAVRVVLHYAGCSTETDMYIGGILGTILIVLLIIWLARRI